MNGFNQINGFNKQKTKEINLKELFNVIKSRYWIVLATTMVAAIVGIIYSYSSTTFLYQASSRIIIGADEESRKTLQVIIRDSTVLDHVVENLQLNRSSEALASQISVQSIDGSQVVSISVVDTDPKLAAKIADTTAKVFKEEEPKILGQDNIRLLSKAKVNYMPINQNRNQTVIMLIIAGIVVGIGLVFLLDSLDDSIRSEKEAETLLGLPILGKISKMNKKSLKKRKHIQFEMEKRGGTIDFK